MKKTYAAPTAINSGSVLHETLGPEGTLGEGVAQFPPAGGRVGYYL